MPPNHNELIELLEKMIADLEAHQRHPKQMGVVARRLGNIILHMKELLRDLQPVSEAAPILPPGRDGQQLAPEEQEQIQLNHGRRGKLRP